MHQFTYSAIDMLPPDFLFDAAILLLTLCGMEWAAWALHRYVMHGWGWNWHVSHHRQREGMLERNDLYAVVFAALAIALIWFGSRGAWPLQWIGAGMTAYGALYAIAHDGLVHRRWPWQWMPRNGYFKRLYQAHRLHHAMPGREGGVSFGFLFAPSAAELERLRDAVRAARATHRQRAGPRPD